MHIPFHVDTCGIMCRNRGVFLPGVHVFGFSSFGQIMLFRLDFAAVECFCCVGNQAEGRVSISQAAL